MATNLHDPLFRYPQGVGYKVYVFQAGSTTTPVSTYADPSGETPNEWPVVLADAGNGIGGGAADGIAQIYVTANVTVDVQNGDGLSQPGYPSYFVCGVTLADLQDIDQRTSERLDDHDDALFLLNSRAADLEDRATAVEDRATALEERTTALEERVTATEEDIATLQDQMTTANDNIIILNSDAEAASTAITALQGQMTTANDNIAILNTGAEAASAAITTLQDQMATANDNIAILNADAEAASTAITTLQGQMTTANTSLATLDGEVSALQEAVDGLVLSVGDSDYSWDKESETLTSWGTFSTASDGRTTVYYPLSYDVIPVVMLTTISAALFVTSTLTALDTISFSVYACNIDGSGTHVMAVDGRWLAVGKKAA